MRDIEIAGGSGKLVARYGPLLLLLSLCVSCSEINYHAFRGNRYSRATNWDEDLDYRRRGGQRGTYKVGRPYKILGKEYCPEEDKSYREVGVASWYGEDFHSRKTANGDIFDMNSMTAAHRTLPMPSIVRVTNLENGKSAVLEVNDRGPFANDRIIDVSRRAAQRLGFVEKGIARVKVEFMEKETNKLLRSRGFR
jgi:rare lipoprotein A